MDQPTGTDLARRKVLTSATAIITLAAVAQWLPTRAALAQAKLAKSAVAYQETAKNGKDCDDCIQFVAGASAQAPATCKIVEGPISPHAYCQAFTPKPKG